MLGVAYRWVEVLRGLSEQKCIFQKIFERINLAILVNGHFSQVLIGRTGLSVKKIVLKKPLAGVGSANFALFVLFMAISCPAHQARPVSFLVNVTCS